MASISTSTGIKRLAKESKSALQIPETRQLCFHFVYFAGLCTNTSARLLRIRTLTLRVAVAFERQRQTCMSNNVAKHCFVWQHCCSYTFDVRRYFTLIFLLKKYILSLMKK